MSYRLDHSGLDFLPLASGELFCIVPEGHELAGRKQISAAEIVRYPLIGIDPTDPYGRIMAEIFARKKLDYESRSAPGSAPRSARWSRPGLVSPSSISSPSPMAASPASNCCKSSSPPNSTPTSRSNTARRCRSTSNITSDACVPKCRPAAFRATGPEVGAARRK